MRGGGHRMAAGLSLTPGAARAGDGAARRAPRRAGRGGGAARGLRLDGVLAPGAATPELAERIAAAGPYGAGSPAPRLALAAARIAGARRIGEGHLALRLADGLGGRLDAVAFRALEGPLGGFLERRPARARTSPGGSSATSGPAASA